MERTSEDVRKEIRKRKFTYKNNSEFLSLAILFAIEDLSKKNKKIKK